MTAGASQGAGGIDRFRLCGWVGVLTLVAGMWASSAGTLTWRHPLPEGVKSPILALELIRSSELVDQIARPAVPSGSDARDERQQLARAIRIDYVFIAAYAVFFACLGWLIWSTTPQPYRALAMVAVGAGVAAAVFDVRENLAMLGLLEHTPADPRWPSLVKWRLVFVAIACSAPVFVDRNALALRRWIGYVGGALGLVSAFQGVFGTLTGNDRLIEVAAGRLSVTFLVAVVFLLTRRTLREGLVPALNRLAKFPVLSQIAEWPASDKNHTVGPSVLEARRKTPA